MGSYQRYASTSTAAIFARSLSKFTPLVFNMGCGVYLDTLSQRQNHDLPANWQLYRNAPERNDRNMLGSASSIGVEGTTATTS